MPTTVAGALNTESTASLMTTTRNLVEIGWNKKKGRGTNTTKIQNNSERVIFLIPIFCARNANPRSSGTVENELARRILARDSIVVDSEKYNQTRKNSGFQTHILFRAADTDDIKEYLKNFKDKVINVETVEQLVLHDKLYTHDLELKCTEGKDIVDGNAVQVARKEKEDKEDIRKPVAPETLVDLIMDVVAKQEGLKKEIKALLNKMEILMEAWKSFDQKDHELHRAKLDPSFSTNTPSSSK